MEQMGSGSDSGRRKSVFVQDTAAPDNAHIRTELVLMQRKYERLAQKEKRMMVSWRNGAERKNSLNSNMMAENVRRMEHLVESIKYLKCDTII